MRASWADTLRIGVARGDYPEAAGREEEWMAERLMKLESPQGRHEPTLSNGRCNLTEERRTSDGRTIGLRVDEERHMSGCRCSGRLPRAIYGARFFRNSEPGRHAGSCRA
jgi:hypothetical protein